MRLMVVGGGGREHAIVQKLRENPSVKEIFVLPGNAGMASQATCVPISATDLDGVCVFAREQAIDFAVVAPDDPLCLGLVDRLEAIGVPAFGPTKLAAEIEGSKVFAKGLMKRYNIPTAAFEVFNDPDEALAYVQEAPLPLVVKADGLALGKGVLMCYTKAQAEKAVCQIMLDRAFGASGSRIVIEECMTGPEASLLLFTDGESFRTLPAAMDHKRAKDGDRGLNTGGMGVIAPNPYVTPEVYRRCVNEIIVPVLAAMKAEGRPFRGCLFAGLMITEAGPKVIEFNCRFGDPEAQALLALLESDLLSILMATRNGTLAQTEVRFREGASCCVVLASGGYPEAYQKGYPIQGLSDDLGARVDCAGVGASEEGLVTAGGRVLGVTAIADTLPEAIERAYAACGKIHFQDMHYRRDIGQTALRAAPPAEKKSCPKVYRIYVEKRPPYAVEAKQLLEDIRTQLGLTCVTGLRVLNRYDVEGVDEALFARVAPLVFFEPQLDLRYDRLPEHAGRVFAWEALPGQFDQRADSCAECIQLISQGERPLVRTARVYLLEGDVPDEALEAIMAHVINPVESRPASLEPVETLANVQPEPPMVETIAGFRTMDEAGLEACMRENRLAMEVADLRCCQAYFEKEVRDPTATELFMLDAYWSDHCRHTTFLTALDEVEIDHPGAKKAYERFLAAREGEAPPTLMELATFGGKSMRKAGKLPNLDVSEEINACTVRVTADVDGRDEPWLFLFKNETHNHPTEIEPFGGAATCIGGAIRDPLSGRAYVYHAMRITGAGDPTVPLDQTLPGKLPQRKLTQTAAAGFSSYGNQIGLATGLVQEIYHPGYVAKRMELGAVLGAAPLSHVRRECPAPGDVVLLIGGRTGRDGIGGASGSSKAHEASSLTQCGAEVQKGNAPTERKLQRLFRGQEAARLIKRCNDFGAGGVSVAIGELADGLSIDLDAVPKKYEGLDGTELAISESQERMAVVVAPKDADRMIALANAENLEATRVAVVTEAPRLRMTWRGQTVLDLSRDFLNSNGAQRHAHAKVPDAFVASHAPQGTTLRDRLLSVATDLNVCSQKGLSERFDSTIGAATVLMPFGGKRQLTPIQTMVAKLPVLGETTTCSGMAYGFNPYVMEQSPFDGAYLAVCESVAKLVAAGFSRKDAYLTLQEYFERLGTDPLRWGKPLAALLGALAAQEALGVASIGGKDSMSGSFERLCVPPTLVSFAVATGKADRAVSTEFKAEGRRLVLVGADPIREPEAFAEALDQIEALTAQGKVEASWVLGHGGLAEALLKMGLGNGIGSRVDCDPSLLFGWRYGFILLCLSEPLDFGLPVGETIADEALVVGAERVPLSDLRAGYEARLHTVFPYQGVASDAPIPAISCAAGQRVRPGAKVARPQAFIPVFPGTNCEYDTVRAIERAGGTAQVVVLNNLSPAAIGQSVEAMVQAIGRSQMIVLPGGFSGGDEPDGSAKLILSFFRNPRVAGAVEDLLHRRDGLVLGICNGFQALIKLGLVPYGTMREGIADAPTLTYNTIGRHQSMLVRTRIASNRSPWLSRCAVGEVHTVAISHGEGRFVIDPALFEQLAANGQIATQYVDLSGCPTWDLRFNPNASYAAVEGITSPDGRILGKMGHTERSGAGLYKNVAESAYQPLFEGGVDYFA